ncbi:hypothetical protein FNV43_RR02438 [Rhamnella rubrinervis]|uniref:Uncharacterized protein n=1 Tax=Rhamnella rubrinervis TaxID=2594499 RepID=A0A8K0HSM3_9ROSA|nr:hypothetical protein FNV43_RR02438 [Rhamnella rubrinervis]
MLMELKKELAKNKAKSLLTKAIETNSTDKFLSEMEVVKFGMADPMAEIIEIDSYQIDVDHVDGLYNQVDSDGVDNSFIVESEYENAMKKAASWSRHKRNIKHFKTFFTEAEKLELPKY